MGDLQPDRLAREAASRANAVVRLVISHPQKKPPTANRDGSDPGGPKVSCRSGRRGPRPRNRWAKARSERGRSACASKLSPSWMPAVTGGWITRTIGGKPPFRARASTCFDGRCQPQQRSPEHHGGEALKDAPLDARTSLAHDPVKGSLDGACWSLIKAGLAKLRSTRRAPLVLTCAAR